MEDSMSSTNYKRKTLYSVSKSWSSFEVQKSIASSSSSYTENDAALSYEYDECSSSSSSSIFSEIAAVYSYLAENMQSESSSDKSAGSKSKRRKSSGRTFIDHDLEDTATSPTNLQEERKSCDQQRELMAASLMREGISLREKGLCLVPVSMLFNSGE